jgi:hypothetical protein
MTNDERLPFAELNLRVNPFGALSLRDRAEVAVVEVGCFVERLSHPRSAVQFVGEKGRGKTTHLLAIWRYFPSGLYIRVPQGVPPRVPMCQHLFIDELQHMPRRLRRRLFQRGMALAIGTHEDVSAELQAAAYDVETVHVEETLDVDRLWSLLNRRVEWARRQPGPVPRIRHSTASQLRDAHRGDVRAIECSLYETFQSLRHIQDV